MQPKADQAASRRLTVSDADAAAEVLARAFMSDPLWRSLFPEPDARAPLLRQAFRSFAPSLIADNLALGVGAPLEGVAVWGLPDRPPPRLEHLLNPNLFTLLFSPLLTVLPRAAPIFSRFEGLQRRYAPEPHYYLSTIGVVPEAQGRGRASALIRPVLAQADARGFTCYTETVTPENVPLYERYGFVVREEVAVPESGLRLWAMYRPRLAESAV
jgi:GNAT superfamily N-acetyltransferase